MKAYRINMCYNDGFSNVQYTYIVLNGFFHKSNSISCKSLLLRVTPNGILKVKSLTANKIHCKLKQEKLTVKFQESFFPESSVAEDNLEKVYTNYM